MQELHPYKITPEEGWSQMRTILDKAMPAERRSRRILFFWLTSAAGIIALSAAIYLFNAKTKVTEEKPLAPSAEVLASKDNSFQETNDPAVASPDKKVNNEQIENSLTDGNKASKNPSALTTNKKDTRQNQAGTSIVSRSATTNEIENPSNPPIVEFESTATVIIAEADTRNTDITDFLPLADVVEVENSNLVLGNFNPVVPAKRFHPSFHPAVSIAGIAGTQNSLGWNANAGIAYSVLPELDISANVGYTVYRLKAYDFKTDISASPDLQLIADFNADPTYIFGEKVNTSTDYSTINSLIHSISQWQVSGGLCYSLSRKFSIDGGFTFGFNVKTKSEYPIVRYGSYNGLTDPNIAKSFDSYEVIRSTMTSVYAGFGFHVSPHLSLQAKWVQGSDHYILNPAANPLASSSKRTDYLNGLGLGIEYKL